MYRWLDRGRDDGLTERELDVVDYVETPPPPQEPLEDEPGNFALMAAFMWILHLQCMPVYLFLHYRHKSANEM